MLAQRDAIVIRCENALRLVPHGNRWYGCSRHFHSCYLSLRRRGFCSHARLRCVPHSSSCRAWCAPRRLLASRCCNGIPVKTKVWRRRFMGIRRVSDFTALLSSRARRRIHTGIARKVQGSPNAAALPTQCDGGAGSTGTRRRGEADRSGRRTRHRGAGGVI